jgi:NTE family protein
LGYFGKRKKLNLALQGGGAHGAFTWGVLDEILADDDIEIGWLSGTSAGAVNALAVAHGLAHNDRELARETLRSIWRSVERAGIPDLLRLNPFFASLTRAASISNISNLFSPYDFNPLGFDPLRDVLTKHVDFEKVRADCPVDLVIAATDVASGRARLFRRHEISVEAILASACLPNLHHAVRIGGRHYWDGGFSANPDLLTLARESPVGDTLLVQLNPIQATPLPRSSREIEDRVNTVTFNQPLLRDLEMILTAQRSRAGWFSRRGAGWSRMRSHRLHLVEAGRHTAGLSSETKAVPDNGVITYLHGAGRIEARRWLGTGKAHIGRRGTVDLEATFFAPSTTPDTGTSTEEDVQPLMPDMEPMGQANGYTARK